MENDVDPWAMNVWDMYFTGLVSMALHPGYLRDNATKKELNELGDLATKMLMVREEKCPLL